MPSKVNMKYFKWIFLGIGTLLVVFLLLLACVSFYLDTDGAQKRIQAQVNQVIPGTVIWSKGRFSILEGTFELEGIQLKGLQHHKVVESDRLFLKVAWMGLLKGEIIVKELALYRPRVYLSLDPSANLNLIQAVYSSSERKPIPNTPTRLPFNLIIRQFKFENGFFQYKIAKTTTGKPKDAVVFQKIDLTVRDGDLLKQKAYLNCRIENGHIIAGDIPWMIDQVSLTADLQNNGIQGLILDVHSKGFHLKVTGDMDHLFTKDPLLNLNIKNEVFLPELKYPLVTVSGSTGTVKMDSTLKGSLNNPTANLRMTYGGGKLDGIRVDQIMLDCRLEDRFLTINSLNVNVPAGRMDLNGHVNFKQAYTRGFISSRVDPDAISYDLVILQKDMKFENDPLKKFGFKGLLNTTIKVQGKGINPQTLKAQTDLVLVANQFSSQSAPSNIDVHMKARAGIEHGRISIRHLNARAGEAQLITSGDYDFSSLKTAADFDLSVPDLKEIGSCLGIKNVSGAINVGGKVQGTARSPLANIHFHGKKVRVENILMGDADAIFRLSKGKIFLDHGKINNGNSELNISGTILMFDPTMSYRIKHPTFEISLDADALFMEDFVQGTNGKFILNGHLHGDVKNPSGEIHLKGENINLYGQNIQTLQLISNLNRDRIHIDPLMIMVAPDEKIILNGWVSMEKNYDVKLVSSGISLKNISQLKEIGVDGGKVSLDFRGKGSFKDPFFQGNVDLRDVQLNDQSLQDSRINVEVKGDAVHISGNPGFSLDAGYHFKTHDFSASARFSDTDLAPYLNIAGRKQLKGSVTGKITVSGDMDVPNQIHGTMGISRLVLFSKQSELIRAHNIEAFLQNGEVNFSSARLILLKQGFLEMKGRGNLGGNLDLKVDGQFPLKGIALLTGIIPDASGQAFLSLRVKGNLSQPEILGHLDLKDAGLTVPGLLQNIHDLNGSVHLTSEAIVFDNFRGMLNKGGFELLGTIDLKAYRPVKIHFGFKGDNLPLMIPDTLEARFKTKLTFDGTSEKSLVSGDVQILEGTYYKNMRLNLVESIGKKSRKEVPKTSEIRWPFLKNTVLDIKIGHREPFVIDNNIALMDVEPDLRLYGTVNQPLIRGRVQVESGTVFFRKKEFKVKRGIIDFINPYKIEPEIDVQSEVKIREWTLYLNISGTPDNPKITMTSKPPEKQEDILSLLITGKTIQEMIAEDGGVSGSPKQMLADILSETLQEEIKDATGLDVVEIEFKEAGNKAEGDEVNVRVGKELSQRLTVKYGISTDKGEIIQKLITEYKFLERLLMNAFQDTDGNYGGGLQYRFEFR